MSEDRQRIERLKQEFDLTFAAPPRRSREETENFLSIGVGGHRFALRVSGLSGLQPRGKIVHLAGARSGVLGLAGVRGRLVPVYGLARLLGYAQTDAVDARWLALCGQPEPLALAFAEFHGQHLLPLSAVMPIADGKSATHLREIVTLAGLQHPVIDLTSLLKQIHQETLVEET